MPAKALDHDMMDDRPPISANECRRSNADRLMANLMLTQSEQASVIHNKVIAKYDASYNKSKIDRKLIENSIVDI